MKPEALHHHPLVRQEFWIPDLPSGLPVSAEMRALVKRMLSKEAEARPTATEAAQTLDRLRMAALMAGHTNEVAHAHSAEGLDAVSETTIPPMTIVARDRPGRGVDHPDTLVDMPVKPRDEAATEAIQTGDLAEIPSRSAVHRPGRVPIVAGTVGLIVVLGGVGAWLALGGTEPASEVEPTAMSLDPAPVVATTPAPTAPASPIVLPTRPDPSPSGLRVGFDSTPPGARVFEGGRDLGTTPFETTVAGNPGERTFVFRLDRYQDVTVTKTVRTGAKVSATLVRKPPSGVSRPKPTKKPGYCNRA
jgi:hypothetical protein